MARSPLQSRVAVPECPDGGGSGPGCCVPYYIASRDTFTVNTPFQYLMALPILVNGQITDRGGVLVEVA